MKRDVIEMRKRHTNRAGSQGSDDSGGIPQSSTPSIAGGYKRARIRDSSSWNLSEGTACSDEGDVSIETSGSRDEGPAICDWSSWTISSEMWARIWFLWAIGGRRIMTWAFVIRRPEKILKKLVVGVDERMEKKKNTHTVRRTFHTAFRWFILSQAKTKSTAKRETGIARHGDEGSHIQGLGTIVTMKRGWLVFWITLRVIIVCNKPFQKRFQLIESFYTMLFWNNEFTMHNWMCVEPFWLCGESLSSRRVRSNSDVLVMHFFPVFQLLLLLCLSTWIGGVYSNEHTKEQIASDFFNKHGNGSTHTNNWAVLVCASRYWFNYRVSFATLFVLN